MIIRKIKVYLLISLFSAYLPLFGWYENISSFKSQDYPVTVYTFGDDHSVAKKDDDATQQIYSEANERHRAEQKELFAYLKERNKKSEHIIVEDMAEYPGSLESVEQYSTGLAKCSYISPLAGLIQASKESEIPTTNIEYRFERPASMQPFLRNNPIHLDISYAVTNQHIIQEYNVALANVKAYNDEPLNDYYSSVRKKVKNNFKPLRKHFSAHAGSVASYIESEIPKPKRRSFSAGLIFFDAQLLDVKATHLIYQSMQKTKQTKANQDVFLFAGKGHTYPIGQVLENLLSFKKIWSVGQEKELPYPKIDFTNIRVETNQENTENQTTQRQRSSSSENRQQKTYLAGKTLVEYLREHNL